MTSRAAWEEREAGKRASAWVTLERLAEEGLAVSVELDLSRRCARIRIQASQRSAQLKGLDLCLERPSLREAIHAAEQEVRRSWASQGPRPREEEQP